MDTHAAIPSPSLAPLLTVARWLPALAVLLALVLHEPVAGAMPLPADAGMPAATPVASPATLNPPPHDMMICVAVRDGAHPSTPVTFDGGDLTVPVTLPRPATTEHAAIPDPYPGTCPRVRRALLQVYLN